MNEPTTEDIAAELQASHHKAHESLDRWFREDMARHRARMQVSKDDFELEDDDDDN